MRWLWASLGFVLLGLGAIGIFLPLWPVTIFWILAVFCLAESHPQVRDWIYRQPGIGSVIERFVEHGQISRGGKRAALGGILVAGLISGVLLRNSLLAISVLIISLAVAAWIVVSRPEPEA